MRYEVRCDSNTTVFLELISTEAYPVGIYLVECDGQAISEFSTSMLDSAQTNPGFLVELNLLRATLKANKSYNLIPCTYKAGQV